MEIKEKLSFLRNRIEVLSVRKRRLQALLGMTNLEESGRKAFIEQLDATLGKLHRLSVDLSRLEKRLVFEKQVAESPRHRR